MHLCEGYTCLAISSSVISLYWPTRNHKAELTTTILHPKPFAHSLKYTTEYNHFSEPRQRRFNNHAFFFITPMAKLGRYHLAPNCEWTKLRFPCVLLSTQACAFHFPGYGVQFLFLAGNITYLSYWHVFFLTALAGNGICWINTVSYLICIRNFPSDSRIASGLSTSYIGLSAKVYTALVGSIFRPEPSQKAKTYLLLNATAPMLVSLISMPLLRVIQSEDESQSCGGFVAMFIITLATGLCAVLGSIGSGGIWSMVHILSLGTLLFAPIAIPAVMKFRERMEERLRSKRERRIHVLTIDEAEAGERDREVKMEEEECTVGGSEEEEEKEEGSGFIMLIRNLDFWLYFFTYMFGATLGTVFLNNLGQISESRGLPKTSSLVSLASSFGFFGRLFPSLLDYFFLKRGYMVSRPAFMALMMAPMAACFLLLNTSTTLFLFIATAVISTCSGAIMSAAVPATSELFGVKNFALNHNIVVMNIPIGSFLFGYFAAVLYQRGGSGGSISCMGTGCYFKTFVIWSSVCSFGTLLCTILYFRTCRGTLRSYK